MKRSAVVVVAVLALVGAACGAKNDGPAVADPEGRESPPPSTSAAGVSVERFGDLPSPCGRDVDGVKATVKADEAGKGTDKLYLGVRNERTSNFRPGLLKELWDASLAFTKWCNAQGGIGGLQIEPVDLDGQVLKVEQAMATACTSVFALVGGGFVQDNLMFSGKDGSDFHKCKLIDLAGFAVSTDLAEANGVIQALPNPARRKPAAMIEQLVKLYPEKMKKTVIVWGKLDAMRMNMVQLTETGKKVEGFGALPDISYDAIGQQDWNLVAQQVKDSGATAVSFVGEPNNFSKFAQKLREQDFDGVIFAETNHYDEQLLTTSGADAVEGVIVRTAFHPFEEANRWPATKQLVELVRQVPGGKLAALSNQSFSAWLLFATAARECVKKSGGELSRDCVMEAASKIRDWTAGGLHAATDPGGNNPPECSMLVQVKKGKWTRLYPKIGSADDDGGGFNCGELGIVEIQGDLGQGNVDPSRKF